MDALAPQPPLDRLEADLAALLKRLRLREEEHRKFFEYNNKINSRWNQIADEIFIHDELSKLKNYAQEKVAFQQSQQILDQEICTRYEHIYSCPDSVVLLMRKVAARAVELAQQGFESLREPIQYYSLMANRFKTACLRASSDAISCRPANLLKIFARFLLHKVQVEADRLREIANCLELGDSKSLQGLKQAYYRRLYTKELLHKEQNHRENNERADSISMASVKFIKKDAVVHSEKDIRIKLSKHEEKQREKIKKLGVKRLKKYVHSLCEVLELNKEQMLEDIFIGNKQSQSRRIYTELTGRNKHNQIQILAFLEKAPEHKEMPPPPKVQEEPREVKHLEAELLFEKKISPVKSRLEESNIVIKINRVSPTKAEKQPSNRYTKRESLSKPRTIYKRQRNTNNGEEVQKEKEVFQTQKQPGEFIEINLKNQEQKQRFPEIHARATSVDTVKMIKKEAHLKYLKEQKLQRDNNNRDIARGSLESSNQTFASKKNIIDNAEVVGSNSNIQKQKGRQKIETKIKLELKTMGPNFFDQIGKRISKFCEMKKNLVA